MEYVQVFINSLSDRYQNTCQLVMHQKMMLLSAPPASLLPAGAAAYLTWICAFAWRLTSAKIMREMWSSSSNSRDRDRTLASLVSPGCPRRLWWRLTEL